MKPFLIDTHVWIWLVFAEPKFSAATLLQLREAHSRKLLYLSPISLWEVALKASRGKLALHVPVRQWMSRGVSVAGLQLVPITVDIAADSADLPAEFHGDPADRIIAATARNAGFTLVTHDKHLLRLAKQGYLQAMPT